MKGINSILLTILGLASVVSLSAQFENPLENLDYSYSENSVEKSIQKAAESRKIRIEQAFSYATGEGLREGLVPYFANLWLGKNLKKTNEILFDILTTEDTEIQEKHRLNDPWCLATNQLLYHMYYAFGSKGTVSPGRINARTEKAMLDFLWEHLKYKNDIHLARKSTWWMIGSENHDLVSKVSSLISSQIFMNEPEYMDRVYPDPGTGGGHAYWFHHMYGNEEIVGPEGRANYGDGKPYTAADHYREWINYFDVYFSERAKKGFFLENASPGYMAVSVSYLTDIFDLCQHPALSQKAENFLDVVWADWAQDQLNGVRGGAKTRVSDGNRWADAMYQFARFYFGGKGNAQTHFFAQLLSSYELKPLIWHMALDRQGLGEFAYISRKPGEEENVWPRPLGTERTMVCDTESRFVKYSWVTPDYILGCQMDHPGAVHSHLSIQKRWQGITFKGENGPRVYPTGAVKESKGTIKDEVPFYRCVQNENVMLVQQSRGFSLIDPDWFPTKSRANQECAVYFGDNLDRIVEKGGWIFVEHGDALLALKVVMGEYAQGWTILKDQASPGQTSELVNDSYQWSADKKWIRLKDNYAGMIFEASRHVHHKTLEIFMDDVLDNSLALDKTVVPGFHVLRYKGCGDNAKEIYFNLANNEMSMIDWQRIDYAPDMVFDSPYLKSTYNSGIVNITKGEEEMHLDFNSMRNTEAEIEQKVVSGLKASVRPGQVFLTWDEAPVPQGVTFNVYMDSRPITASTLSKARLVGHHIEAGSACDWWQDPASFDPDAQPDRSHGFLINGKELDPQNGLFVHTAVDKEPVYFAVLPSSANASSIKPGINSLKEPIRAAPMLPQAIPLKDGPEKGSAMGKSLTLELHGRGGGWDKDNRANFLVFGDALQGWREGLARKFVVESNPEGIVIKPLDRIWIGRPLLFSWDKRDHVPAINTWWYGCNEGIYDPEKVNEGVVVNYTEEHLLYLVRWAQEYFGTDPDRTYIRGKSMGGSGAISTAFNHPEVFATVYSYVPIVSYTKRSGRDGISNLKRLDGLCGRTCDETIMSSEGIPVMERMNSERIVLESSEELPFLVLCNGRTDGSIPWVNNPSFYRALNRAKRGFACYWNNGAHNMSLDVPEDLKDFYSLQPGMPHGTSFPAFSNFSGNYNPGNGEKDDGDITGWMNRGLYWTDIEENENSWSIRITAKGSFLPPELEVDVTPRRLEQFAIAPHEKVLVNGTVIKADKYGLLTIPEVKLERGGAVILEIHRLKQKHN